MRFLPQVKFYISLANGTTYALLNDYELETYLKIMRGNNEQQRHEQMTSRLEKMREQDAAEYLLIWFSSTLSNRVDKDFTIRKFFAFSFVSKF